MSELLEHKYENRENFLCYSYNCKFGIVKYVRMRLIYNVCVIHKFY